MKLVMTWFLPSSPATSSSRLCPGWSISVLYYPLDSAEAFIYYCALCTRLSNKHSLSPSQHGHQPVINDFILPCVSLLCTVSSSRSHHSWPHARLVSKRLECLFNMKPQIQGEPNARHKCMQACKTFVAYLFTSIQLHSTGCTFLFR